VAQTLRASSPRSGASNESPPIKRLTSEFENSRSRTDFLISSRDGETRRSARAWFRSNFATARRTRQHQHQSSGGKGASASKPRIARVDACLETHGSRLDDIQTFVRAIENNQRSDESLSIRRPAHMRVGSTTRSDLTMANFKLLGVAAISVNDNRGPGNGTASGPRTRRAGFLREFGRWIPQQRHSECYGVGTQRFVCERSSETLVSEALRA
jgi:hypothetical protein